MVADDAADPVWVGLVATEVEASLRHLYSSRPVAVGREREREREGGGGREDTVKSTVKGYPSTALWLRLA